MSANGTEPQQRRRRLPRGSEAIVGLTVCAMFAIRCSAFNGSDTTSGADGGADAAVASGLDGGPDGIDASAKAPDGALCSSPHSLCDDFNRQGPPFDSMIWGTSVGDGGALGMPSFAKSPALLVDVGDAGTSVYRLLKTISGNFHSIHCSFRLYVEDTGTLYAGIPFSIGLIGTPNYSTYLSLKSKSDSRAAQFVIDTPSVGETSVEFFPLGVGSWFQIDVTAPDLQLSLNGLPVSVPALDGGPVSGTYASALIEIGMHTYENGVDPHWAAALDDIVCDTK